jgi:hypothetical protein
MGNVKGWYAVRMRNTSPRIVIELRNLPPGLTLKAERQARAKAAAREMLARRTLRYADLRQHGPRAIADGIRLLEQKGYVERRGRGRTARWKA